MSSDLKEYEIDDSDIREWIKWGFLVTPNVFLNKDESFMGCFSYGGSQKKETEGLSSVSFLHNGWVLWSERQHLKDKGDRHIATLLWDAPYTGMKEYDEEKKFFCEKIDEFQGFLNDVFDAKQLKMNDAMDYLASTITLDSKADFPEIPAYLDVFMLNNADIKPSANSLMINDKNVFIVSILNDLPVSTMDTVEDEFDKYDYRFFKRTILMDEDFAERAMEYYTRRWCGYRSSMKDAILDGHVKQYNGYVTSAYIFYLPNDETEDIKEKIRKVLLDAEATYIFEDYNFKDIWLSSIPGSFRTDLTPPVIGIENFSELFIKPREGKERDTDCVSA